MIFITRICVDIWLMGDARGGERVGAVEARLCSLCVCEPVLDSRDFLSGESAAARKT